MTWKQNPVDKTTLFAYSNSINDILQWTVKGKSTFFRSDREKPSSAENGFCGENGKCAPESGICPADPVTGLERKNAVVRHSLSRVEPRIISSLFPDWGREEAADFIFIRHIRKTSDAKQDKERRRSELASIYRNLEVRRGKVSWDL